MPSRPLAAGYACSIACLLFVASASAQDTATAGALFEKGVADMEAGHFDSACPAIEESQRIDPRPGTLFTVAECQARWGKVASAAARYQEYVDLVSRLAPDQQARHKARVDIARTQLAKLKPTVPTLTLVLPADAPPGTFVTRNGEVLKGAALGLALPVDPGEYLIVTHLPNRTESETRTAIQLGEAKRIALELPTAQLPTPPPLVNASPNPDSRAQESPPQTHGTGRKTAAYVAGGVGVAGVALGSVTGIVVLGKKHTVSDNCHAGSCNDAGLSAANSGKTLATISDIGFGVGIAGLAVGAILWLTGDPDTAAAERARSTSWQPVLTGSNGVVATGLFRRW